MALDPREVYASTTQGAAKRIYPTANHVKEFATGTGTLLPGTVIAFNSSTNKWVPWANGGANDTGTPRAIVWPEAITLNASNEVNGVVMMAGRAHASDLIDQATGNLSANLTAALRVGTTSLRQFGILIDGLTQIR